MTAGKIIAEARGLREFLDGMAGYLPSRYMEEDAGMIITNEDCLSLIRAACEVLSHRLSNPNPKHLAKTNLELVQNILACVIRLQLDRKRRA